MKKNRYHEIALTKYWKDSDDLPTLSDQQNEWAIAVSAQF
jgi:hypothetical protein